MADQNEYYVGQIVHVYSSQRYRLAPGETRYVDGTITRVGTKLLDIDYPGGGSVATFCKDTQRLNGDYASSPYFRTREQVALTERAEVVRQVLIEHGLRPEPGCTVPLNRLEAIAVILQEKN